MINLTTVLHIPLKPEGLHRSARQIVLIADAYREDPDFRASLDSDPVATLAENDVDVRPDTEVRVVQDTAEVFHFVLPPDFNIDMSDEMLGMVAGGKSANTGHTGSCGGMTAEQADLGDPRTRGGGIRRDCFLTTAVVERRGEADDGPTLTALRGFRDGYMMETAERRALVEDYYRTAPAVVAAIPADHADWGWIGDRIDDAAAAVGKGDDDGAFAVYVDLMERLTSRWLGSAADGR